MSQLINLLPDALTIKLSDNSTIELPKCDNPPLSLGVVGSMADINGIPASQRISKLTSANIPEPQPDTYYIVTTMTAYTLVGRTDLLIPTIDKATGTVQTLIQFVCEVV